MRRRTSRTDIRLPQSDRPRAAIDYSARSDLFALASYDGQILVWRASNGQLLTTLRGPSNEVQVLRFSPDGRTLASFTKSVGVRLWDVVESREGPAPIFLATRAYDLAFSPDGQLLAAADSNNAIELWNAATRESLATLTGHAEPAVNLAFSPDGRTLASASDDGTVKLWSLAARRELATLFRGEPLAYLQFAPDGRTLIGTSASGHLRYWRAPAESAPTF